MITVPGGDALDGGILVFFPSYSVMEKNVMRWKSTQLYNQLVALVGAVIVEPKGSNNDRNNNNSHKTPGKSTNFVTTNFKPKSIATDIETSASASDDLLSGVLGEFNTAMRVHKGCLLFAVCRFVVLFKNVDDVVVFTVVSESIIFSNIVHLHVMFIISTMSSKMALQLIPLLLFVCTHYSLGRLHYTDNLIDAYIILHRGKVSEGIDFTDNKGRVVIVTGSF